MEKLLHEQLRDIDVNGCSGKMLSSLTGAELKCTALCTSCISEQFNMLADRIEKEYVLLPCDKDGKPWNIGDECIYNTREDYIIGYAAIGQVILACGGKWEEAYASDLERPAPKVLDADGVEIKVGETLYCIITGEPVTVEALENVEYMEVLDAKGNSWNAQFFTHERPVFDANGERICKGDTVWPMDDPTMKMTVDNFQYIYGQEVTVNCEHEGDFYNFSPQHLTHREPDSLEKLRDRMHGAWQRAWAGHEPITEEVMHGFVDDITALIERGV